MNTLQTIQISTSTATADFDRSIFENITWSMTPFRTHREIAETLDGKNPHTITVLIEPLKWDLRNKKEYVRKTKTPAVSKYRELLYSLFFEEFGQTEGNDLYAGWLKAYRTLWQKAPAHESIDDYIIARELEPRYKQKILSRFTNHESLFAPRVETTRERYYRLPKPLDYVDWRTPYDNLFIWEENGQKQARRGGSGSSGARETNSALKQGGLFMQWDPWHTQRIEIIQYD